MSRANDGPPEASSGRTDPDGVLLRAVLRRAALLRAACLRWAGSLHCALVLLCVLGLGLALLLATGPDDPYITFWPAHTLAHLGEILSYGGERVEQSSTLLLTLWLGGLAWATGVSVPALAYASGILFGLLATGRSLALARRLGHEAPVWVPLIVGTLPAFLYWWFASMETTLVAWLGVEIGILACDALGPPRRGLLVRAGLLALAFVTVRPEGFAVLASTLAVTSLLRAPAPARRAWLAGLALVGLAFGGVTLLRWLYFDAWVPLPVESKLGGDPLARVGRGLEYFLRLVTRPFATTLALVLAVLPVALLRELVRPSDSGERRFLWLLVGAHAGFVLLAGGDWMKGARFFVHFAPLALVLGLDVLWRSGGPARLTRGVVFGVLAGQLAGLGALAITNLGRPLVQQLSVDRSIRAELREREHPWFERASRVRTRDALFLARAEPIVERILAERPRVVIASGQAGMVMYHLARRFFPRIDFVDRFGLTSAKLRPLARRLGAGGGPHGLGLELDPVLTESERPGSEVPRPDLVFDIYPEVRDAALRHGYVLLYEQTGADPGVQLPGVGFRWDISVYQVLLASSDVAARLGVSPESLTWPPRGPE